MADNDAAVNPDGPAPQPEPDTTPDPNPAPAPEPKGGITAEGLKADLDALLKMLRGVEGFVPAGPRKTLDRLLTLLDVVERQDWLFTVLVAVLHRVEGKQAGPDELREAVFQALVSQGEQAQAQQK